MRAERDQRVQGGFALGTDITATGFLGGHAGRFISSVWRSWASKATLWWCAGESRTCINIWDEAAKRADRISGAGLRGDGTGLRSTLEKFVSLLPECEVVTISGSTPKGAGSRCTAV